LKTRLTHYLGVEPFKEKFISSDVLSRFLNFDFYKEYEFDEDEAKSGNTTYIYEYGKPVDYFVLIINGNAELETGKEKIVSEIGSFYYFGITAIYVKDFLCFSSSKENFSFRVPMKKSKN
jgi:metal transporter CNNM